MAAPHETSSPPQTDPAKKPTHEAMRPGLVIVNYGKNLLVEDDSGLLYRCVARRGLKQMICGDRVTWQQTGREEGSCS